MSRKTGNIRKSAEASAPGRRWRVSPAWLKGCLKEMGGSSKKKEDKKNKKLKENHSVASNDTTYVSDYNLSHVDEDDYEGAMKQRMELISAHGQNLTLSKDAKKPVEDRVNLLVDFLKKKKEEGVIDSADKEILAEAERLDIKVLGPLVLTEVLFDDKIKEQIKKYRRHFLRFCLHDKKAQKYLLHGFECVVDIHQGDLLSQTPHILKEMYDADLLEEKVVISWAENPSKTYVSKELAKDIRAKAEPFIRWLKEAEGASSDDDNESLVVIYSTPDRAPNVETVKVEDIHTCAVLSDSRQLSDHSCFSCLKCNMQ